MIDILIFGTGGHSKVVSDIVGAEGKYRISKFFTNLLPDGGNFLDIPCFLQSEMSSYLTQTPRGLVAIGDNWTRMNVVNEILQVCPQFEFVSVVHPRATLAESIKLGLGSVVMAGAVINADSVVGDHCIINTNSSIDHDCDLEKFSSIAPGATLGGKVQLGEFSAVGLGANVIHSISIGDHVVVGAGALVNKDLPSGVVAYGVPAAKVRDRSPGEKYLK